MGEGERASYQGQEPGYDLQQNMGVDKNDLIFTLILYVIAKKQQHAHLLVVKNGAYCVTRFVQEESKCIILFIRAFQYSTNFPLEMNYVTC